MLMLNKLFQFKSDINFTLFYNQSVRNVYALYCDTSVISNEYVRLAYILQIIYRGVEHIELINDVQCQHLSTSVN